MTHEHEDLREQWTGVGATAEALIEPLAPLIEYYAREMGELPGRLMMALSFLDDAQLTRGWSTQSPEARQAIQQARALVVSVMIRLLNAQETCGCADASGVAAEMEALLDRRPGTEGRSPVL
jgi:hypothetical protein